MDSEEHCVINLTNKTNPPPHQNVSFSFSFLSLFQCDDIKKDRVTKSVRIGQAIVVSAVRKKKDRPHSRTSSLNGSAGESRRVFLSHFLSSCRSFYISFSLNLDVSFLKYFSKILAPN